MLVSPDLGPMKPLRFYFIAHFGRTVLDFKLCSIESGARLAVVNDLNGWSRLRVMMKFEIRRWLWRFESVDSSIGIVTCPEFDSHRLAKCSRERVFGTSRIRLVG